MKQLIIALIISALALQVFAGQKSYDFEDIPSDSFPISVLPLGSPFAYIFHGGSGYAFAKKSGYAPFGEFSMAPLNPQNSQPYSINFFDEPLSSFSFEVADSDPDEHTMVIRAYSETGRRGQLLAEVIETLPAATGFRAKRITIEAIGIRSVYFIGDSRVTLNSVFYDNFKVGTQPLRTKFMESRHPYSDLVVLSPYSDFAVLRGNAFYALSADGQPRHRTVALGPGKVITGDYDGDNLSDLAVFNNGIWSIQRSNSPMPIIIGFGLPDDIPLSADFDNDGKTDIAVFRPEGGFWYVLRSSDGQFMATQFGSKGDIPLPANYDADGRADFAVFRPSDGVWYILGTKDGFRAQKFGISTDKPIPADYDADGIADIGVFRNGYWYILKSTEGFYAEKFGQAGDIPVPNNYLTTETIGAFETHVDIAVFRPEEGTWYVRTKDGFYARQWGQAGDVPVSLAP